MIDPFDPSRFVKSNTCLPCCAGGNMDCGCALFIVQDPMSTGAVFSSYADAQTAIGYVADCMVYAGPFTGGGGYTTSAVYTGPNVLEITFTVPAGGSTDPWASISLLAGSRIAVDYNLTFTPADDLSVTFNMNVVECDTGAAWACGQSDPSALTFTAPSSGTIDFGTVSRAGWSFCAAYFEAPADGTYLLNIPSASDLAYTLVITITCDGNMVVNPPIALWDDSGTTRKLWACPKLVYPVPGSGPGGSSPEFPSLTDATDFLATNHVSSGCLSVGAATSGSFTIDDPGIISFTATGTTSLSLAGSAQNLTPFDTAVQMNATCCINAVAGDTLSVAWTVSTDATTTVDPDFTIIVRDDTGTVIDSFSENWPTASGTYTLSVPYTGLHYITVAFQGGYKDDGMGGFVVASLDWTAAITSSGAMSPNPLQAVYTADAALTCPGRVDCT